MKNTTENWNIETTWICPKCKKELPSGIVGISSHWAECGGKEFQKELEQKIKNPDFGINELKKLQKKHNKHNKY